MKLEPKLIDSFVSRIKLVDDISDYHKIIEEIYALGYKVGLSLKNELDLSEVNAIDPYLQTK